MALCPPDIGSVSTDALKPPIFVENKEFELRDILVDKPKW
jgi:hypothetical protein